MKSYVAIAGVFACVLPSVHAWGTLGHATVAYIATNLVKTATKTYFQGILDDSSTDYLASIASWSDDYRYTSAGSFSAPYHFIDANDKPPTSCSVDYDRDCGDEGCVISAIHNYTSQLLAATESAANLAVAAKMVVHFVGDIHQPLHDEALDVGGNTITVNFANTSTNLHHIWDTNMPEKLVGGYALSDAKSWAASLTTAIKTGSYRSKASGWTDGIDISDPQATGLIWAAATNAYVCSTVMPNGVSAVEDVDLAGAYYNAAIPIIQVQIAAAGYRLAAWLDLIATGSTSL